jgi:hypothetical protein
MLSVVALLLLSDAAFSQCSMCSATAENSVANGNTEGDGLNDGILYLLAAPYLAVAGIGYLWYKNYRKKADNRDLESKAVNH